MKGRKGRILSSVCAVLLAILMMGQTVLCNASVSFAATGDDAVLKLNADGWSVKQMMTNIKIDKKVYVVGKDNKVVVTFDIRRAPQEGEADTDGTITFELVAFTSEFSVNFVTLFSKTVKIMDLKAGTNTVEISAPFATEEKYAQLFITQSNLDMPNDYDARFSVQKESADGSGGQPVPYVDSWSVKSQMSDLKTEKSEYQTGSEQTVNISFKVSNLASDSCSQRNDDLYFIIGTSSFDVNDFARDFDKGGRGYVAEKIIRVSDLKGGANTVTIKTRFENKGAYYVYVVQNSLYLAEQMPPVQFMVVAPTDGSGHVIDTKGSVRSQYAAYSSKEAATMQIFYTVDDSSSKYHLYIRKGIGLSGYDHDQKYVVADFMTAQGNLPAELGKELSVKLNKTENDFSFKGVYEIVLYNLTKQKEVAKQQVYVVPEKYLIQRDTSKMTDDGKVPFYCDANLRNFDLDKDEKYSFQVCFPINYSKYLEQLKTHYYKTDSDLDYQSSVTDGDNDLLDSTLSDNYSVNMTVNYVPEGAKDSRKLFKKKITGMYKPHEVTLSSKEIRKAIYDTRSLDIGYAGVVTVQFSNDFNPEEESPQWIDNEAIIRFTESFSFGVSKAESLTSVEASPATAELEFGGYAGIAVTDTLGGKIIADIYDGKDKIKTCEGNCELKSDGTAGGILKWDLSNSDGNYVSAGTYTVKVHTENEFTVYESDGSTTQKKVTSEEKTTTVNVKKTNKKLSISTRVVSSSGGNAVYKEQAKLQLIIKTNVGVRSHVKVTRGKNTEVVSGDFEYGRGQKIIFITLDKNEAKTGKYKVTVTSQTMDGQKKTSKASFLVKKLPKPSIKDASLKLSGGIGAISFGLTQLADVKVVVKSGSTVKQTVVDQSYSAGDIKTSFSYGGYKPGNYSVVITAKNSGGSKTITKTFTIKKKPVVVKKPTASALSLSFLPGKDGDMVKGVFSYTGKGAKVVIDIMHNDTEEIVYTYQGVTKYDSGKFTWTWDGFKSNGFRCGTGSYTYRVHLVNSAGSTPYLRQNFNLGEG